MGKTVYLTDRTTIETDETCGMKRWWYKDYLGSGIVPVEEAIYFKHGRELHADYAALVSGASIESLVRRALSDCLTKEPYPTQMELEQAWWHAGMVAAFGTFILPIWQANYEPLMVEKELILDRAPLHVACTGDLAWIGRSGTSASGEVLVIDYKTVGWLSSGWVHHWPYAIQMQINPKAVEESLGVKVKATYVVGVQKPSIRDGKARSAYTYASVSPDRQQWQVAWKSGWDLIGLWERGADPVALTLAPLDTQVANVLSWATMLGASEAIASHPTSAPIMSNDRLLDLLIRQRIRRESTLDQVKDACQTDLDLREIHYESRFSHCRPTIGSACPYLAACHNAEVNQDPLKSGLYATRVPHHDAEWLDREGA